MCFRVVFLDRAKRGQPYLADLEFSEPNIPGVGELVEQERQREPGALDDGALERNLETPRRRARGVEGGTVHRLQPIDQQGAELVVAHMEIAHGRPDRASTSATLTANSSSLRFDLTRY